MTKEEMEMIVGFFVIACFTILACFFPNTMLAMLVGYLLGWKVRNDREKSS